MVRMVGALAYWRYGLVAGLVAAACYGLHSMRMAYVEAAFTRELFTVEAEMTTKCEDAQKITQETSDAYQKRIASLDVELANLKRVRPQACIPVKTPASGGRDATPPRMQGEFPYVHGLATDDLYNFAADAEQIGRQLDACQNFVRLTNKD